MSLLQHPGAIPVGDTKFRVSNSIKMDHRNSENFYRSSPNTGNKRTFTISLWTKLAGPRQDVGDPYLASQGSNARFHYAGNTLRFMFDGNSTELEAPARLRDVAAWYHIVLAVDTTQSTTSNRVKAYVNGQTYAWNNNKYPSLNAEGSWMSGTNMYFNNRDGDNSYNTSAYMAQVAVIDGQQLDPTSFGEFDDNGIWICKDFKDDVTFGDEGFYYTFEDASDLGADSSGNNNDATLNNLTSVDQSRDTPTNNFCNLNGDTHVGNQYGRYVQRHHEGNTRTDEPTGSFGGSWGSHSFSSGKWYWEAKSYLTNSVNMHTFGVASCKNCSGPEDESSGFHTAEASFGLYPSANAGIYPGTGSTTSYKGTTGSSANDNLGANSNGSVWQIAFDADAGKIWFGKNDTWQNTIGGTSVSKSDIAAGNNARYEDLNDDAEGPWMPVFGTYNANEGHHIDVNFGGYTAATISSGNTDGNGFGNFEYAPPSGFLAICSENLKSINSIDDPSAHFQVATWTGDGNDDRQVTNDGNSDLKPDLVWLKDRTQAESPAIFDSTRGATKRIQPNNTNAESTEIATLKSFTTDGFTVGTSGTVNNGSNPDQYVAWQWKANGGTTSSNSDGDITSTVQANTTAGFSIVTYTGTGSIATVGHGLGVKPYMMILKNRDSNNTNWVVYHTDINASANYFLRLNTNDTTQYSGGRFNGTQPTSSVFTVGTALQTNNSGDDIVAYCFAEKEGYSIFGKYEGNGFHNTAGGYPVGKDGPFVHTGFRPALIFIKRADNAGSWTVYDEKRDGYNNANDALFWNSTTTESSSNISGSNIDISSNGFKIKSNDNTVNSTGATYIYGAWAAHPQQTSKGTPGNARCF
tara:strand:+ start:2807 stop:5386 length:2580 start_codon:yes stop_codon:yes gene_type:complete